MPSTPQLLLSHTKWDSPVKVFSQRPAFHSLMVLSADPVSIRPCSGRMTTAHTAAVCPYKGTGLDINKHSGD